MTPLVNDRACAVDKFREILITIHDGLTTDNLNTIKFLIRDEVKASRMTEIRDALDLFNILGNKQNSPSIAG